MEVFASQAVARNSAVLFVDAALTPEGCQLGGIAWGPGWCFFFHLPIKKGSCPLIPWAAGHITKPRRWPLLSGFKRQVTACEA